MFLFKGGFTNLARVCYNKNLHGSIGDSPGMGFLPSEQSRMHEAPVTQGSRSPERTRFPLTRWSDPGLLGRQEYLLPEGGLLSLSS